LLVASTAFTDSYSVVQRPHEFGVRMALGAGIGDVVRTVMVQGVRAAVIGIAIASAGAISLRGVIAPLLFQTSPRSPSAFAVAAAVILVAAAAASFVPAWRASRL
jgi:ABC-type antimicrobial peptide transport system permease subunit